MAISRVVSEIFNVKISRPGKHGLGSIKVTENGTIQWIGYVFLLAFYGNFVPKTHRFSDVRLAMCRE